MPLTTIRSAANTDDTAVSSMLSACSAKLAELLARPEANVMTLFDRPASMTMARTANPCCLVETRSVVKLSSDQTWAMAHVFCPTDFADFPRKMWGFNGSTLA